MSDPQQPPPPLSRRRFLQGTAAATAAAVLPGCLSPEFRNALECAMATPCAGADLSSIQHIVMFMQENRSFDQYFGMLPGVRGFGDTTGLFQQPVPTTGVPPPHLTPLYPPVGYVLPIHTPMNAGGACVVDPEHGWEPQHQAWSNGAMNAWLAAHQTAGQGTYNPWTTMAYYDSADLAFYYALANAFTICDAYHCSVIGPTDPNHLYWLSASIDPEGIAGGPLIETSSSSCLNNPDGKNPLKGAFTWKTMPEVLEEHSVSWKFYGTKNFSPYGFTEYFAKFANSPEISNPYYVNGVLPTFEDFLADAAAGRLPAVSWVLTDFDKSEHASFSPQAGIQQVAKAITALATIPDKWASTVLFLTYDENGGFFDHVAPPTPPAGTPGEYITSTKPATGCQPAPSDPATQPIGLGFRVPMLVISPYSRGGFVCSDTFDHTSMLRFIETRYAASGMRVPNLSAWRRGVTGDLTTALNLKSPPNLNLPLLPQTDVTSCKAMPFPVPNPQVMPQPPARTPVRPPG